MRKILLISVVLTGCYSPTPTMTQVETPPRTERVDEMASERVAAVDLCRQYYENPIAADDRFLNKTIEVETVANFRKAANGENVVVDWYVAFPGRYAPNLRISLDNPEGFVNVQPGGRVIVKAVCNGSRAEPFAYKGFAVHLSHGSLVTESR